MIIRKTKLNCRYFLKVSVLLLACFLSTQQGYATGNPTGQNESVKETLMPQDDKVTIEGIITEETVFGDPLIGVSITQKGTTNGTTTNIDGRFTLNVPVNSTIVISFLGFKAQEIKLAGETTLKISLKEDAYVLGEVVTIGYGSTRREDLSTAISSVKIDKSMKSSTSNLNSMLQGRLSGVTIMSSGGDPLKEATINIRGRGSKGNETDPNSGDGILFIVDGVPNAPYNVEDIETVTVLKDAASAAIYGANVGSGGVIIITTKQAQEGKIRVNVNVSHGIKVVSNLPEVLTAAEYNMVWAKDSEITGRPLRGVADPVAFPWGTETRTDWLDEIFRTANVQHYALSLSGGSKNAKVFASISYDKEEGTLLNTWSEKVGAKLNADLRVTDWLRLRENVTFQYGKGQGDVNTSHEGPFIEALRYPRSATVYEYDQEGKPVLNDKGVHLYGGTVPMWSGLSGYGALRNPVAELNRLNQNRPKAIIYSTTTLEAKPISRLTIKSDFTTGLSTSRMRQFYAKAPELGRPEDTNKLKLTTDWDTNWLWESTATYAENFAEKHNVSLMAGYSMNHKRERSNMILVQGFDKEDDYSTLLGQAKGGLSEPLSESHWVETMISGFARVAYSFDDRYFVTGSVRRDASSKLPSHTRADMFYAASASWKISSEQFFKNLNLPINLFKLRASWGQIGNVAIVPRYGDYVPIGLYPYFINLGNPPYVIGSYQTTIHNPNLRWETTEQTGFGIDLTVLDNSLDISVDYFTKDTKGVIDNLPITQIMGLKDEPLGNLGLINNKGWEFSLSYRKSIGDFSLNVYGNLSTVKNEVKRLSTREQMPHTSIVVDGAIPLQSSVGQPWYSIYVYEAAGVFKNQNEINEYMRKDPITGKTNMIQPNAKPGDLIIRDTNDDGVINDKDRTYQGSYLPKITYSFGARFDYKGIDLNFMFQGVDGNKIYNGFRQMGLKKASQGFNMPKEVLNSWSFNPESNMPGLPTATMFGDNYDKASSFFVESGSYLRLKNVSLGYTLPKKLLAGIGMPSNNLRVYISGENLLTISPYTGVDPEVGNNGVAMSTYPLARVFSFGLSLDF